MQMLTAIYIPILIVLLGYRYNRAYLKFGSYEKKKAEAIQRLYGGIMDLHDEAGTRFGRIKRTPLDKEKRIQYYRDSFREFSKSFNKFISLYNHNSLYLSDSALKVLNKNIEALRKYFFSYQVLEEAENDDYPMETKKELRSRYLEIDKIIPVIRTEIEMEFKKLIS